MSNSELKVTILGYAPYSFFNEKENKNVEGCTVWFIEEKPQNDDYGYGFIPRKATMPFKYQEELAGVAFPYVASPELVTRFTSKGAKAVIENFNLINPVRFVSDLVKK